VLRPAPARFVGGSSELLTPEAKELEAAQGKGPHFMGFVEGYDLKRRDPDASIALHRRSVLDGIALHAGGAVAVEQVGEERARFLRLPTLSGVEALHATFIVHRYVPHIHDTLTLAYVDRGAATFDLEGGWHVAPAGSAFLIPPHWVHTGESAAPSGYTYRVLYLEPEELAVRSDERIGPCHP
jgi:hypothetical protein